MAPLAAGSLSQRTPMDSQDTHSTVHAGFRLEEGSIRQRPVEFTCQVEAVAGRWRQSQQQQPEELPLLAPP